jgi:hypothetical protein
MIGALEFCCSAAQRGAGSALRPLQAKSRDVSGVTKQGFEAVVHVLLNMAMKQSEAGLIGGKVHNGTPIIGNHNRILNNSGSFLSIDLS